MLDRRAHVRRRTAPPVGEAESAWPRRVRGGCQSLVERLATATAPMTSIDLVRLEPRERDLAAPPFARRLRRGAVEWSVRRLGRSVRGLGGLVVRQGRSPMHAVRVKAQAPEETDPLGSSRALGILPN